MVCHHMAEGGFCPCGTRLSLAGMPQAGVQSRSICTWMASIIVFTSTSLTTVEALMTAIWIMGPPPVRLVRCAWLRGREQRGRGSGSISKTAHRVVVHHGTSSTIHRALAIVPHPGLRAMHSPLHLPKAVAPTAASVRRAPSEEGRLRANRDAAGRTPGTFAPSG